MTMSDETELLRELRADVPAPTEEARRRIYAYATRGERRRSSFALIDWQKIPVSFRTFRWRTAFALTLVLAAAVIAAVTTQGGASPPKSAQITAQGVDGVVSQVQNSFGDNRILTASVTGSTLSVKLAAPDEPSLTNATFEAQVLGHVVRDWMTANGQAPINAAVYLDATGAPQGGDSVASEPSVVPLTNGTCNSAAQAAQVVDASIALLSVQSLQWLNGTCVFEFQTSDPASFASNAPVTVGKLVYAMGDPDERPYLVQVDDQAGTPQFVASYVPGDGGRAYIKPGLSTAFDVGSQAKISK